MKWPASCACAICRADRRSISSTWRRAATTARSSGGIKEALKDDRARIQVGRISHFGLLEMSRQRIRTGVLEGSSASAPIARAPARFARPLGGRARDARARGRPDQERHATSRPAHPHRHRALHPQPEARASALIEERFGVSVTGRGRR